MHDLGPAERFTIKGGLVGVIATDAGRPKLGEEVREHPAPVVAVPEEVHEAPVLRDGVGEEVATTRPVATDRLGVEARKAKAEVAKANALVDPIKSARKAGPEDEPHPWP